MHLNHWCDNARLLGGEEFVPQRIKLLQCLASLGFCNSATVVMVRLRTLDQFKKQYAQRMPAHTTAVRSPIDVLKEQDFENQPLSLTEEPVLWIDWERGAISDQPRSKREGGSTIWVRLLVFALTEIVMTLLTGPIFKGAFVAIRAVGRIGAGVLRANQLLLRASRLELLATRTAQRARAFVARTKRSPLPQARVLGGKPRVKVPPPRGTPPASRATSPPARGVTRQGAPSAATGRSAAAGASGAQRRLISADKVFFGTNRASFRRQAARLIDETPGHPLKPLLDAKGNLRSGYRKSHDKLVDDPRMLEMGHVSSRKSLETERIALQSAWTNQFDRLTVEGLRLNKTFVRNEIISIAAPGGQGAIAVEIRSAMDWVDFDILAREVFENAPRVVF